MGKGIFPCQKLRNFWKLRGRHLNICLQKSELEFVEVNEIKILKYLVTRPNDTVEVLIVKNKNDNTYSFVNITKGHICPCRFKSIRDAIADMDKLIQEGEVIRYEKVQ